jgi:PEP-CTERM motif
VTLDFPGSTETNIIGINEDGAMVGSYFDSEGVTHGSFAGSSVPEPSSVSLVLVSPGAFGFWRLRRR